MERELATVLQLLCLGLLESQCLRGETRAVQESWAQEEMIKPCGDQLDSFPTPSPSNPQGWLIPFCVSLPTALLCLGCGGEGEDHT